MPRARPQLVTTLALAALAALAGAGGASAHDLQVLAPGTAKLDAGTAEPSRLMHATLLAPDDRLELSVTPSAGPVEALLLVPDRAPEQDRGVQDLPTLRVAGVPARQEPTEAVRDEETGFAYLVLARVTIPQSPDPAMLLVSRGREPTRAALRVGPPDAPFTTSDPDRTPRALVLARGWLETEPAGASDLRSSERTPERGVAWFGLAIGLVGVLVAAWWVARGRATSRRRGVERATDGDD